MAPDIEAAIDRFFKNCYPNTTLQCMVDMYNSCEIPDWEALKALLKLMDDYFISFRSDHAIVNFYTLIETETKLPYNINKLS